MDTVVIENITYTKAAILAKKFQYTTDYIGQLCRADKVDAQLIGRSWYVSESSLMEHSGKRLEAIRQDEITLENNSISTSLQSEIKVSAPLSKITKKMLQNSTASSRISDAYSSTKYEEDLGDLLPAMQIRPTLPIIPTVKEITPTPVAVFTPENTAVKERSDSSFVVPINQPPALNAIKKPAITVANTMVPIHTQSHINTDKVLLKPKPAHSLSVQTNTALSFTPASVAVSKPLKRQRSRSPVLALGLVLLGLGAILSALMLDVEIHYDGTISSTTFSLNQTALLNFFK